MSKNRKPHRTNLDDAFIALSDEDNCLPSDDSTDVSDTARSSTRNFLNEKAKTATTEKKKKLQQDKMRGSTGRSSYSTDYLRNNLNLQSPSECYTKNKMSQSKQCVKLIRAESLSTYDKSQSKSKNLCSNKTRRSLESNNPPLPDISNNGTPEFSKTLRMAKFEKFPERPTPKTSKSKPSSERERVERNIKAGKLKSRMSYPGCTTAQLNPQRQTLCNWNIEVPDAYTQVSAQTVRNFIAWRRSGRSTVESVTNLEIVAENDRLEHDISNIDNNAEENTCFQVCCKGDKTNSESNNNFQFASPNLTDLPCCGFEPRKILNTDINLLETQLWLQNDLSAIPRCRHARIEQLKNGKFRDDYLNHLDVLRKTDDDDQGFVNTYSRTKQKYYEKRKVDLVEFEHRERHEVKSNELNSACEVKSVKSTCNIKGTDKSPWRINSNVVKPENLSETESPEATFPLQLSARDGSPNRQVNQFSQVITPESPLSALMNKNLTELYISKK